MTEPKAAPEMLKTAFRLHQAGRLDEAEALYLGILGRDPGHGDALHLLGLVRQRQDRHAEAVELIGRAIARDPGAAFFHSNLANSLMALHRLDDAAAALERAVGLDPTLASAHLSLALASRRLGRRAEAEAAFRHALAADPESADACFEYGTLLLEAGGAESGRARPLFERAARLRPDWAAPHAALGALHAVARRWAEAEAAFTAALARDPAMAAARLGRADTLFSQDCWEEALADYRAAVAAAPDDAEARIQLGQFLANLGTMLTHFYRYGEAAEALAEARAHFDRAAALAPDAARAFDGLASVDLVEGRWAEAEANARCAVALDPGLIQGRHRLSLTLQHQGRIAEAEAEARALLARAGDGPSVSRDSTARILPHLVRWQGRLDHAVVYTDEDVEAAPPPAAAPPPVGILPLAVLADHDFCLDVALGPLPAEGRRDRVLVRDKTEAESRRPGLELMTHGMLIGLDGATGAPWLSLGDGRRWSPVDRHPLSAGADCRGGFALRLVRRGGHLAAFLDGRPTAEARIPSGHAIPGDTLVVGTGAADPGALGLDVRGFRVRIANYRREPERFRRRVHMLSVFYGDLFARLLTETMFPSLLLSGNLSDLRKVREVVHNIYCTGAEVPLLRRHFRRLESLGIPYTLDTKLLESGRGWVRNRIHLAVIDQIERAIADEAVVLMAPPDHVFGHGLARAVTSMAPLEYLVAGHPRVDLERGFPAIRRLLAGPDPIDNRTLVDAAMRRFPHHVVTTGLANPQEPWWNAEVRRDGFAVRFKEPPPLAFHPTRDLIAVMRGTAYAPPFETIDHDLVDLAWRTGRLRWIADSDEFFWVEYCKMSRNVPTIRNTYWSPAARMLARAELRFRG